MGLYSGENAWVDQIYQFEETDVVLGGPDGIDNQPLKELADRTAYLKNKVGVIQNLTGHKNLTSGYTLTAEDVGMLLSATTTSGVFNITLPNASFLPHGAILPFLSYTAPGSVIFIQTTDGQFIRTKAPDTKIYMHNEERLVLIGLTDHFRVLSAEGNFFEAGEEIKARREMNNTLAMKGQSLQRNLYPRLWNYIASLTVGQEVTTESTWFSHSTTYRGLFTTGNGTTTFRLPDERGTFDRMLDLGRGLDIGRTHNYPGGYEADDFKSHNHSYTTDDHFGRSDNANDRDVMQPYNGSTKFTSSTGGTETRGKNIAKLNLIKY